MFYKHFSEYLTLDDHCKRAQKQKIFGTTKIFLQRVDSISQFNKLFYKECNRANAQVSIILIVVYHCNLCLNR